MINKRLFFLHIQKTGGVTVRNILFSHFKKENTLHEIHEHFSESGELIRTENFDTLSETEKENSTFVTGHFRYGFHEKFNGGYTYMTMLRDPIERTISHFFYSHENPTIQSFNHWIDVLELNLQVKYIAGLAVSDNKPVLEKDFEHALENIKKHFIFTGITDRYVESLFLLNRQFGWENTLYSKRNVTAKRPAVHELPRSIVEKIRVKTRFDQQLYDIAKTHIEKSVAGLPLETKASFGKFKIAQLLYQNFGNNALWSAETSLGFGKDVLVLPYGTMSRDKLTEELLRPNSVIARVDENASELNEQFPGANILHYSQIDPDSYNTVLITSGAFLREMLIWFSENDPNWKDKSYYAIDCMEKSLKKLNIHIMQDH